MAEEQTHLTIWLQPWCDGCEKMSCAGDGRMWCQDEVFGNCEECGRPPVKYALAGEQPANAHQ